LNRQGAKSAKKYKGDLVFSLFSPWRPWRPWRFNRFVDPGGRA
jgi:hypothetical protein